MPLASSNSSCMTRSVSSTVPPLMAGDADYIVHLAVRDTRDFERIHNEYLSRFPGVARLKSNFAIRTICETTRHHLARSI